MRRGKRGARARCDRRWRTGRRGRSRRRRRAPPQPVRRGFGGIWDAERSGISRLASLRSGAFMSSIVTGEAQSGGGRQLRAVARDRPCAKYSCAAASADLRRLPGRKVALVGDEVLEDHLLDCGPCSRCSSAIRPCSDCTRSSSLSPMPTRMPLVKGIFSSARGCGSSSRRRAGCLVGRARVDRLHQALGDRTRASGPATR